MATLEQLEAALRAADAAGNTEDARRLAQAYAQMRQAKPKADFSGVRGAVTSTESVVQPQTFPNGERVPSLEEVNAGNRAYRASPQYAQDETQRQQFQAEAAKQRFQGLPAPARMAIGGGSALAGLGRGVNQLGAMGLDAIDGGDRYSQAQQLEAQARQRDAAMSGDWAATTGKVAGAVGTAAVPLSRVGQLGTAARYGTSAAVGAGYGALQPTVEGESRGANVALGAGLGMAGQGVADVVMKSGAAAARAVTPELRALYERAKAAGINLTPAQLSNSEFVRRTATQLGKLPFGGARKLADSQQAAGNREIAKLLGQEADAVTPQVMADAADQIGQKFDTVFQGGMRYDTQFLRELGALRQEAAALDDTGKNALDALIKRVRSQAQDGALSGRTLQSLDQQARKWASGGGDRQHVAQAFRESLHEAFGRQAPAGVKATWNTARKQWATLKSLEPVVARNPEGGIPLAQLQGAVNATKAGRTARARGRDGELGKLASIGQRIKQPSSSGTAENAWASQAANPLAWPVLALGAAGGLANRATLNNAGLSGYLMRAGRGQGRQLIAPAFRPAGVSAAGGLSPQLQMILEESERNRRP